MEGVAALLRAGKSGVARDGGNAVQPLGCIAVGGSSGEGAALSLSFLPMAPTAIEKMTKPGDEKTYFR